ncbi:hypothetical protein AAFF_G00269060 [Aldrovandia affinis]|uniref:Uncharacterized protein n=1 Tax=Aldrovandia affinis TaxID=143900 RepID=A0AAD7WSQ3_9TELE|nr:hypothetical protein AAFF_G00269060 [Aldrovandia affinis]
MASTEDRAVGRECSCKPPRRRAINAPARRVAEPCKSRRCAEHAGDSEGYKWLLRVARSLAEPRAGTPPPGLAQWGPARGTNPRDRGAEMRLQWRSPDGVLRHLKVTSVRSRARLGRRTQARTATAEA